MSDSALALVSVDVRIEDEGWTRVAEDMEQLVERALQAAANELGVSGMVEILLTDDAEMQSLNRQWRDKDKPTDVLSFPSGDPALPGMQRFLGDLALGLGVVERDAAELERSPDLHMTHLLVHGFLHLMGYDHMTSSEAQLMEGLEARILAEFGLPDPYGDSA